MKHLVFVLLFLSTMKINGQEMKETYRTVIQLFVATDQQNWDAVEACFTDKVNLDYSSMNGSPAASLSPKEITIAWKGILPGFQHTHHQLGNFIESVDGDQAHVFCYGTATHYLDDENGNIWKVVGSYDFDLVKEGSHWKITSMKFNFKYQDGNTSLPQKAIGFLNDEKETESPNLGERNKASVLAFLKALEEKNVEAIVDLFAENGKHINPYHSGIFPEGAEGKEEIRKYWTPVFPNFDGMSFPIKKIYSMEDPNMVYVEYSGHINLKNEAGLYSNEYYSIFRFDKKGKIAEYVEIFNPIVAARGFGLIDKIH